MLLFSHNSPSLLPEWLRQEVTEYLDPDSLELTTITTDVVLVLGQSTSETVDLVRAVRAVTNSVIFGLVPTGTNPSVTVAILNAGADDVVPTSISASEFHFRVLARCRFLKLTDEGIRVGDTFLANDANRVQIDTGGWVDLTRTEATLLRFFMKRPGICHHKSVIMNHLYLNRRDGEEPKTRIVDVLLCKLKRKLANIRCQLSLETIWGEGVRLVDLRITNTYAIAAE